MAHANDGSRGAAQVLLPALFTNAGWVLLGNRFGLTQRQLQAARLICRGCTNPEIATALRVSEGTVRLHTDGLFKAMNVRNRVGVVVRLVLADRVLAKGGKRS